ncbi:MAG: hypothetical protein ACKVVT_09085 [Dehalococcoidia bacterium]
MTPTTSADQTDVPEHAHHWHLAEQGQPTSSGQCVCGATREFSNVWPDRNTGQMAWPGRRHSVRRAPGP